jgi:hypothetical protein
VAPEGKPVRHAKPDAIRPVKHHPPRMEASLGAEASAPFSDWSVDVDDGVTTWFERREACVPEGFVLFLTPRFRGAICGRGAGVAVRRRCDDEVDAAERFAGQEGLLERAVFDVDGDGYEKGRSIPGCQASPMPTDCACTICGVPYAQLQRYPQSYLSAFYQSSPAPTASRPSTTPCRSRPWVTTAATRPSARNSGRR